MPLEMLLGMLLGMPQGILLEMLQGRPLRMPLGILPMLLGMAFRDACRNAFGIPLPNAF